MVNWAEAGPAVETARISATRNARSRTTSLFNSGLFTNRWLLAAVGFSVLVQRTAVQVPFL